MEASDGKYTKNVRYHTLDAWRGIACLFVVIYHSTIIHSLHREQFGDNSWLGSIAAGLMSATTYLHVGVPMFFVISGYCITATVEGKRDKLRIRDYFYRRFRRIFLPYWCAIALLGCFYVFIDLFLFPRFMSSEPRPIPRPWWFSGWQWLGGITLTETWRHYLIGEPRGLFLGQAWTLCYEEQFYAVMGLLLWYMPKHVLFGAFLVTLGTGLAQWWIWRTSQSMDGCFFDGHWHLFAAGIAVYYRLHGQNSFLLKIPFVLFILAWISVILATIMGEFEIGWSVGLSFALILILGHRWDTWTRAWSITKAISYCGNISYSLYLTHTFPVIAITKSAYFLGLREDKLVLTCTIPLCLITSLAVAHIFYHRVEKRFLNSPVAR